MIAYLAKKAMRVRESFFNVPGVRPEVCAFNADVVLELQTLL